MSARDASLMTIAARQILWEFWHPIGVNKSTGAFGEYDSYAPTIVSLLHRGCSAEELETHLIKLEASSMGLSNAPRHVCFSRFDDEDDAYYGIDGYSIALPSWVDSPDKQFESLGAY